MSVFTQKINTIVKETDPYCESEVIHSFCSIISLIVKECLIKIKVL